MKTKNRGKILTRAKKKILRGRNAKNGHDRGRTRPAGLIKSKLKDTRE